MHMKRLMFFSLLALTASASLPAQQASFLGSAATQPSFLSAAENTAPLPALVLPPAPLPAAALSAAMASAPLPDAPAPPPVGGGLGNRWDLAAGYEYVHFSSAPFSANLSGLHTSVAYS